MAGGPPFGFKMVMPRPGESIEEAIRRGMMEEGQEEGPPPRDEVFVYEGGGCDHVHVEESPAESVEVLKHHMGGRFTQFREIFERDEAAMEHVMWGMHCLMTGDFFEARKQLQWCEGKWAHQNGRKVSLKWADMPTKQTLH